MSLPLSCPGVRAEWFTRWFGIRRLRGQEAFAPTRCRSRPDRSGRVTRSRSRLFENHPPLTARAPYPYCPPTVEQYRFLESLGSGRGAIVKSIRSIVRTAVLIALVAAGAGGCGKKKDNSGGGGSAST